MSLLGYFSIYFYQQQNTQFLVLKRCHLSNFFSLLFEVPKIGAHKKVMCDSALTRSAPGMTAPVLSPNQTGPVPAPGLTGHVPAPGQTGPVPAPDQTGPVHLHFHLPDHQRASTGELRSGQVYFSRTPHTQLARRKQSVTQVMSSLSDLRQRVERF